MGHIEPVSAVIRIGGSYGEPFTWAAALRYLDPTTVEILGAMKAPTLSEWKELKRTLNEHGITKAVFTRIKDGRKIVHEVT